MGRCCVLYLVCSEMTLWTVVLISTISGSTSSKTGRIGGGVKAGSLAMPVILILLNVPVLFGVLNNSEPSLKWGIFLKAGSAGLFGMAAIFALIYCDDLEDEPLFGPSVCIVAAVACAFLAVWIIWGLWATNAYYAEITGVKLLPCCCVPDRVAPVMMGAGNAMMYPGQPSYAPVGSVILIQPNDGQLILSPQQQPPPPMQPPPPPMQPQQQQ